MRTLGVLGTMVWDRIVTHGGGAPVEAWGGITYALEAAEAALPHGWRILPLIKVGRDLEAEARTFLDTLPRVAPDDGVRIVDAPNNRVELHYHDPERRTERLSGGVPAWSGGELLPLARRTDALYINFISGAELEVDTAMRLRRRYTGPIYADLHSLLLGVEADGRRTPRRLPDWREWLDSFDAVQVNEDELSRVGPPERDPWDAAASAVTGDPLRLLLVTLGQRGAAYVAAPEAAGSWSPGRASAVDAAGRDPRGATATSERPSGPTLVPVNGAVRDGDPTGCGDVWGVTCFARLLAGDDVETAMRAANAAAARTVEHRGAPGLRRFLGKGIGS